MRLSEIADKLAVYEGATAEALLGVIRAPAFLALLSGQPGRGRTSPMNYLPQEIARVRLLLAARECGLTGPDLIRFNAALNSAPAATADHPASADVGGAKFYPGALQSIIRGTLAGEAWVVRFRFTRTREGQRIVLPCVFWRGPLEDMGLEPSLLDVLNGLTLLGTLIVPASELIRPFLSDLQG